MKNEIDKTVEWSHCAECGMFTEHPAEYHTIVYCWAMKQANNGDSVRTNIDFTVENHPKFLALKADLATTQQGLEHYAAKKRWPQFGEPAGWRGIHDWYDGDDGNDGYTVAQQTLDKIGKE